MPETTVHSDEERINIINTDILQDDYFLENLYKMPENLVIDIYRMNNFNRGIY